MNELILKTASSQIGVKEVVGESAHNQTILDYAIAIGLNWIESDEVPWCAVFVSWVLFLLGLPYLKTARAADFLTYGVPVLIGDVRPGDIMIFKRKGGHHVGFYTGHHFREGFVWILGGNQSNQVKHTAFNLDDLVGISRAVEMEVVTDGVPPPPLQVGSTGKDVTALQSLLKYFGFYSGKVDGIFGPATKVVVTTIQARWKLPVSGSYDQALRDEIFSRLNA